MSFSELVSSRRTTFAVAVLAVAGLIGSDFAAAPAVAAPAAPSLSAIAGDAAVALSWSAPTSADVVGYRLYRGSEPVVQLTSTHLVSGSSLVSSTGYTDSTVTNSTTYFYVVTAIDTAGAASPASNEVIAVPNVPNTTNVRVDFTATNGRPAAGYYADWGEAFGVRTGASQGAGRASYGWLTPDGIPLSLVGNGRDRGRSGIPELLDSIIHLQYGDIGTGTQGVKVEGVWELAVPNGLYQVTLAVGDKPDTSFAYDSQHVINVEGTAALETFQSTAAAEYKTATTKVAVYDGAITIDATGGYNTKLAYIDVLGIPATPVVDTVLPGNRAAGHDVNAGVSATIKLPYAGIGLKPSTLTGNVRLYAVATGAEVPSTVGSSGGNDVISLAPNAPLVPNTQYRFAVGTGVTDNLGAPFLPFTSIFTTGSGVTGASPAYPPITGVSFEKIEQPIAAGRFWASFAFGPDGKLYGTTIGQGIWRYTVGADGTLSNEENLGYEGVAQIGLLFDKGSTASSLKVWVTRTTANFSEQGQWVSSVHLLSGPNLATDRTIFEGLPRSLADHLTNSMAYGPDGRIYFQQGSNQGSGDLDGSWGQRGEQLLTAATLVFDPANSQVSAAANGDAPIDVKTADGGTYTPYAPGAPLKLYATGIRNAYDLVWHSNGHLYVATNGTAGGANTPGVTANANGTFTRVAASGIPGFSTVNGRDVTAQCIRRGYTGGSVPAQGNIATQRDLLFDVVEGGYYGHPNPERCEWVLNGGNNTSTPLIAPTKYPAGTAADPKYRGVAYDFEFNKSPNGAIEYTSTTFGGQLKGRLVVVRFSNNNDLLFLQPDPTGKILGAQTSVGITGVANSTVGGVDGFNDPLEVVEDVRNGNLYVNQYNRSGTDQKLYLLRVPTAAQTSAISASVSELVFSATRAGNAGADAQASVTRTVTVTNSSTAPASLTSTLTGAQPGEFAVANGAATIPPNGTAQVSVTFVPGTAVGQRSATLRLAAGSSAVNVGLYGLSLQGIEGINEPPLAEVMGTLGYAVNVGWTTLDDGVEVTAKGEEVLQPLLVKSGTANPTMTPLAQFAPKEDIPFGWYTGNGTAPEQHPLGSIDIAGYQSLLPSTSAGTTTSFDPGTQAFGLYYYSSRFTRTGFTEDRLNTGTPHRARIYPAKNRSGVLIPNTYVVAFEDAANGDYQDYVFLLTGVTPSGAGPVTPPVDPGTGDDPSDGAQVKVVFRPSTAPRVPGWTTDTGSAFSTSRGSGWTTITGTPVDRSTANRYRVGATSGITFPSDVRLKAFAFLQANPGGQPTVAANWEYTVPNGTYEVAVSVGDANHLDSTHGVTAEGQPVISGFAPTAPTPFQTGKRTVTVTDGRLTVAGSGTNTKINWVSIKGDALNPGTPPPSPVTVKVNFQPSGVTPPTGWIADTGAAYVATRGYGWLVNGQPTDRSAATRYRSSSTSGIAFPTGDITRQTLILTQKGSANVSDGVWQYALANGTYTVSVSAGDSRVLDSVHGLRAEGTSLISGFVPTGAAPFATGTAQVTVTDGFLTLTPTGTNTKVNWITITG